MIRRAWAFLLAAALSLGLTGAAAASEWCCVFDRGPTLSGHYQEADMVLLGHFTNARLSPGAFDEGVTDFVIEQVLKPHDVIKGKKMITLPRYLPGAKNKFVIYCEVSSKTGNIEASRGDDLLPDSVMVKYLLGGLAVKDKTPGDRLRYFFDYLNNPDFVIALDAYREFARADYKNYKEMASKLDPDLLVRWLQDRKTPVSRYGLFASLLGHCGKAEHAKVLRGMIDDAEKKRTAGIEGILEGYVMLQPKEAWQRLKDIMKNSKEFPFRHAALRTCRFLHAERPDLVATKDLVEGVTLLLKHGDMADFAIDDLRRWKRWELTDRVLDMFDKEAPTSRTVPRAIVKFALCSDQPRAKKFIQEQRRLDSEWVRDIEELLELEESRPKGKKTPN